MVTSPALLANSLEKTGLLYSPLIASSCKGNVNCLDWCSLLVMPHWRFLEQELL